VRNLSSVIDAETILRDIWLDGQSDIPRDEYTDVMRKLWNWREKMFAVIKISHDEYKKNSSSNSSDST
jgi:hypothetical protein